VVVGSLVKKVNI